MNETNMCRQEFKKTHKAHGEQFAVTKICLDASASECVLAHIYAHPAVALEMQTCSAEHTFKKCLRRRSSSRAHQYS